MPSRSKAKPRTIPQRLAKLEDDVDSVTGVHRDLVKKMNSLAPQMLTLVDTIGDSPDLATGEPGSGMARTVARMASYLDAQEAKATMRGNDRSALHWLVSVGAGIAAIWGAVTAYLHLGR